MVLPRPFLRACQCSPPPRGYLRVAVLTRGQLEAAIQGGGGSGRKGDEQGTMYASEQPERL